MSPTPTPPQGICVAALGAPGSPTHSFSRSGISSGRPTVCTVHPGSGWAPFWLPGVGGGESSLSQQSQPSTPDGPSGQVQSLRASLGRPEHLRPGLRHPAEGAEEGRPLPGPAGPASAAVTAAQSRCPAQGSQRTPAQPISKAESLIFKELSRTFQELPDTIFCDACAVRTSVFCT